MRHRPARLVLAAKREDASSGIHGRSDNEAEAVSAAGEMKLEEVVMTGTKSSWKVTQGGFCCIVNWQDSSPPFLVANHKSG